MLKLVHFTEKYEEIALNFREYVVRYVTDRWIEVGLAQKSSAPELAVFTGKFQVKGLNIRRFIVRFLCGCCGHGGLSVERIESAFQAGVLEAERDISCGHLRLHYGARGGWGEDLARTLQSRFAVELIELSCFTDAQSSSFVSGYDATVEAHVDGIHGSGSVAKAWAEIQTRRKAVYDAWASEQKPGDAEAE